ncbi:MAG: ribosomal protein L11 methyltransferase [Chloroflexi bacterium RBG_13_56_8]|nr:MAG: ribosomal protein L11 methyltransferase [Chloroflexi bacterium RBG_13_56_8]
MRWVEIRVDADPASVDDLVSLLGRHCQGGAVVESHPDASTEEERRRITVKGFLPVWDEDTRQKLEIALLLLQRVSPISEPRISILEPEDWAESWKAHFSPQHIGERTVIVPTWHEYQRASGEVVINLDPGMAFGTGLHATTRLCLEAIERYLRQEMAVLDVGTGSGILAISAALQGAMHVRGIDVDAVAVEVARENVALNQVEHIVAIERATLGNDAPPDVPQHAGTQYDLVLVNILAETIMKMLPSLVASLRVGGIMVGSGILLEKAGAVTASLKDAGMTLLEQMQQDGWVALVAERS